MSDVFLSKSMTSVTCILCRSDELQTLSTRCRVGNDLHTAICTGCGLVFTSPIPTSDEIAEYYATDYRLLYKGSRLPKLKHVFRSGQRALERLQVLSQLLHDDASIVDIGSGGGEFVYLLNQRGYRIRGIEPDHEYANYSVEQYDIDVHVGPVSAPLIPPESIDVATAHHVVEHLCDPGQVFEDVKNGLRPGGYFVVEVPNVESQYHTPSHRWHFAHIFNFNPRTLEMLGRRHGFEVVSTRLVSRCQHVQTVFRKPVDTERNGLTIPVRSVNGNYARVKASLDSYSDWNHYTSLMPAKRLFSNVAKIMQERFLVDSKLTAKEILDKLYQEVPLNEKLWSTRGIDAA